MRRSYKTKHDIMTRRDDETRHDKTRQRDAGRRRIEVLIVVRNYFLVRVHKGQWRKRGPWQNNGWTDEFGCYRYFGQTCR
jgi:hypothetical protein